MSQPLIFKAPDGSIQEVVESETLTLDGLDARIAESQEHTSYLQDLRQNVADLQNGSDSSAAAPTPPAAPADPAAGVTTPPAGVPDPVPATPAPAADGSAPAAPTQPAIDANGNPVAADPASTPAPAINS